MNVDVEDDMSDMVEPAVAAVSRAADGKNTISISLDTSAFSIDYMYAESFRI
jgi:hypothetical protein